MSQEIPVYEVLLIIVIPIIAGVIVYRSVECAVINSFVACYYSIKRKFRKFRTPKQ